MNDRTDKITAVTLTAMLAVLVFVIGFAPKALAAVTLPGICISDPPGDYDGDGYTNSEECYGISAFYNKSTSFPGFDQSDVLPSRNDYLDPMTPDLFVILRPATEFGATYSLIPSDALEFVDLDISAGGLGVATHQVEQADVDPTRLITINQAAIRITEIHLSPFTNCTYGGEVVVGNAEYGTPNGLDRGEIFTQRIVDFIDSLCKDATICEDVGGTSGSTACGSPGVTPPDALDNLYIKQSIAHEIGHMLQLVRPEDYNKRFNGYHYKSGSQVIMEQSVTITSRKGKVTFYISNDYSPASQGAVTFN